MTALLQNPVFLLLLIVATGELVGKITLKSFSFGPAAIIFVALGFGHFGYVLPSSFQTLGLVFFIYSIGLQAGPGLITSFQGSGSKYALATIIIIASGFSLTIGISLTLGYDSAVAAGLFAGALSSSPGLAAAIESTGSARAASAYGVTYIFGVVGVILFVKLLPLFFRIDIGAEEEAMHEARRADEEELLSEHFEVNNPNIYGRRVDELGLQAIARVTITRLQRSEVPSGAEAVTRSTVFRAGDRIRVVGSRQALDKIAIYIGKKILTPIDFEGDLVRRRIVISKKNMVGRTIGAVRMRDTFNVQVSRIMRNGIELPPDPKIRIHMGDILTLVGKEHAIKNLESLMGNDLKSLYKADMVSVFIGLSLGFIIGKIDLFLPYIGTFRLGTTGGVLMSGLILGHLHNTRTLVWELPAPTRDSLNQLGLMLFLAAVGTAAGATIVDTVHQQGAALLLSGALITSFTLGFALVVCRYMFKIPFLSMLGLITAAVTSTPGLAVASSVSDTNYTASVYAAVYPVALITMIVFAKLFVLILGS